MWGVAEAAAVALLDGCQERQYLGGAARRFKCCCLARQQAVAPVNMDLKRFKACQAVTTCRKQRDGRGSVSLGSAGMSLRLCHQ